MARDFDGATQYLVRTAAVLTDAPLTMACWFNSDSIIAAQVLISLARSGSNVNWLALIAAGATAGDPVRMSVCSSAAGEWVADTVSGFSAGVWHHACGVTSAVNARAAYIDGGSKGTNATSVAPALIDRTSIGARVKLTTDLYFNGRIAEAAIWNVALTDAEVAALAKGYSPLFVRPSNLIAYWPIVGRTSPEIDVVGTYAMTVTAAPTVADHPRVLYPSNQIFRMTGSGGAPPVAHARSWAVIIG